MQINGKKEKRLGRREKKNGCEMESIVKVRGDVNLKSVKSSRLPDQRTNGSPLFFLHSGPTLVLALYPEWFKRKIRHCSPFSVSNEKGGAPFNVSYFLYLLQISLLKSLKKKTDRIASLIWRINKTISDSWGTSRYHLLCRLRCRPNRGLSTQKREWMRDKLIQCMIL